MKLSLKILLLTNYLNIFGYALFSPLYAIFAQGLHANIFIIASSWSVYMLTAGIMLFLFGAFENKLKNKQVMVVIGYFILAFGALSFLLVHNITALFVVQIVNAIGVGMVNPAWKTIYSKSEDKEKEAEEWAFYDGGNMILIALGTFIGGCLVSLYGFPAIFFIMFVIQILGAIISLKLLSIK